MKLYLLKISHASRIVLVPKNVWIYRYTLLYWCSEYVYPQLLCSFPLYSLLFCPRELSASTTVPTTFYFLRAPKSQYLVQTSTLRFRLAYLTTYRKCWFKWPTGKSNLLTPDQGFSNRKRLTTCLCQLGSFSHPWLCSVTSVCKTHPSTHSN